MMERASSLPRPRTRRKKLIVKHTLISFSLVLAASAVLLIVRQRSERYSPGEKVEGITNELARTVPAGYPAVQFTEVAEQSGIRFTHFYGARSTQLPEDMGSGASWGDYDGDGYVDLYVSNIAGPMTSTPEQIAASPASNRLYHNNRNGTFTDTTDQAGVGFKGVGMGAAWGDFDNDGHPDLMVTSFDRLILYRNRGDGTFEDVTGKAGLEKFRGFWTGVSWADYDRDGFADLYVCGYVQYAFKPEFQGRSSRQYTEMVPFTINPSSYKPQRNLLFHNSGNGTFVEVAKKAGVDDPTGRSLSAAWADFDNDGWPDIYVANDISDNAMFLNLHNGKFKNISESAWVGDYRGAMGLGIADWDGDGDLDIFVSHWIAQENALYTNLLYTPGADKPGRLRFQDIADMEGLGEIALKYIGWGTSFFEYDNDGRPDLFVVNGSTFQDEKDPKQLVPMQNLLFWNKGPDEGFFEVGKVAGTIFGEARVGRGAAFADYDNDGDVDIFVVNHGSKPWLLRNDGGNKNHWLEVRVRCTRSNRSGFGARVEIETGGKKQFQEIGSQAPYLSQDASEAHFGLGPSNQVDRLHVVFPSGAVRDMQDIPANQIVVVDEP